MTREAAAYIEAIANGTPIAAVNLDEGRKAYEEWADAEPVQFVGTWAEFKLLELQSAARTV